MSILQGINSNKLAANANDSRGSESIPISMSVTPPGAHRLITKSTRCSLPSAITRAPQRANELAFSPYQTTSSHVIRTTLTLFRIEVRRSPSSTACVSFAIKEAGAFRAYRIDKLFDQIYPFLRIASYRRKHIFSKRVYIISC